MRILALEPYHGGSHKAFLDGWSAHSRHAWAAVLGLPAYKWKWRMRHAGITFADEVRRLLEAGQRWDALFCSEMLNLAEFRGLAPEPVRQLPSVVYFHENQLTYPVRHEDDRDYQFVLMNLTTALAATRVWFNSAYHRDSFLDSLPAFLNRMPDHEPFEAIQRIRDKSEVHPPGVKEFPARGLRRRGPLRILWAARWEHDKDPDTFFAALKALKLAGIEFRLNVTGERFREVPAVFDWARQFFYHHIDRWGYLTTREEYEDALADVDVVVSTAQHEFFGISVVEAMAAGAYPLLPRRLAYPEILDAADLGDQNDFFYEGGAEVLAGRLQQLAERLERGDLWQGDADRARRAVQRFSWSCLAPILDQALEGLPTAGR